MAVLGHELLHLLRQDNPVLYQELKIAIDPLVKDHKSYTDYINEARSKSNLPPDSESVIVEEIIADVMGQGFIDPNFWKKVSEESPSLFYRVATAVKNYLDALISKVNGKLAGVEFISDYNKARDYVAKALVDYGDLKTGKPLKDISITDQVIIEETGEVVSLSESAGRRLRQSQSQIKALTLLQKCIGV